MLVQHFALSLITFKNACFQYSNHDIFLELVVTVRPMAPLLFSEKQMNMVKKDGDFDFLQISEK